MPSYPKSPFGKNMPEAPGLPSFFGASGIWLVIGDGFWVNSSGFAWSDPIWVPSGSSGELIPTGTWATNFRPSQFRLISDDPTFEMILEDTNGGDLLSELGADYDGSWLDLAFGDYDIGALVFDDIDDMTKITKIEFR
jgi:hypothetical protein